MIKTNDFMDYYTKQHANMIKQFEQWFRCVRKSTAPYITPEQSERVHEIEHFIEFIILEIEKGLEVKKLTPEDKPEAVFAVAEGDKAVAVYEYCNLHGLWKVEL